MRTARPVARPQPLGRLRKRIAALNRAPRQATLEPAHALGGGAVRERIRHHIPLGSSLQRVIADRARGAQRGLDITLLEDVLGLIGMIRPYAREAVGLQLELHRQLVRLRFRGMLLGSTYAVSDAKQ